MERRAFLAPYCETIELWADVDDALRRKAVMQLMDAVGDRPGRLSYRRNYDLGHGRYVDLYEMRSPDGCPGYVPLPEFLGAQIRT